jgi:hypothetical protein
MIWPKKIPVGLLLIPIEKKKLDASGQYLHESPGPRIQYDRLIEDKDFRDTIIGHEIMHAWLRSSGHEERLDDEESEALCWGLAPYIVQLVRAVRNG